MVTTATTTIAAMTILASSLALACRFSALASAATAVVTIRAITMATIRATPMAAITRAAIIGPETGMCAGAIPAIAATGPGTIRISPTIARAGNAIYPMADQGILGHR